MDFEDIKDWVYDNYQLAYVVGTGVLALGVWALWPGKRSLGALLGGYAAVLGIGAIWEPCVDVGSSVYGKVLARGGASELKIALTFDDGPHPENTPLILGTLARLNVKATFFCVGENVKKYPDLVKRIKDEGHLLGSHTLSHRNLLSCTWGETKRQIGGGIEALSSVLGEEPVYFRPPYGMRYPWSMWESERLAQRAVLWSNCPRDWQLPGAEVIACRVIRRAQAGDIVLLHDGGGDRRQTAQALPKIVETLRERGFSFVRVDELEAQND